MIICSFLNVQGDCDCICHINYEFCKNQSTTPLTLINSSGNVHSIKLKDLEPPKFNYCYSVAAINERFTVVVHGMFYVENDVQKQRNDPSSIATTLAIIAVISLIAVLISIITTHVLCIYAYLKLKQARNSNTEVSAPIYDDLEGIKDATINADRNIAYSTPKK